MGARQLHPVLLHKGVQQAFQRFQNLLIATDLEGPQGIHQLNSFSFHVAGHNAREGPAQLGGQPVNRLILVELKRQHVFVGRLKENLEVLLDLQEPVEVKGITVVTAELGHLLDAFFHLAGHFDRIVNDDLVALAGFLSQGQGDEFVDHPEIAGLGLGTGENHRERQVLVVRVQQNAQQVQDLLGGTDAAGEYDNAVTQADKGLQALLDIRHDHQLVDDGVGRLGGDNARLANDDIASVLDPLLGVRDGGPLHGAFHGTGPAAGTDIQIPQAQLVADFLGVVVLFTADGMAAPADHQIRLFPGNQDPGVAQHVENQVGNAFRAALIQLGGVVEDAMGINDIPQHGEQVGLDPLDHLPVYKGLGRCIVDAQLDPAGLLDHFDIEIGIFLEHLRAVVRGGAGVEHRQGTAAEQFV